MIIKSNELKNPHLLQEGMNNNNVIINSNVGRRQAKVCAAAPIRGDLLSTSIKRSMSPNLVKEV